MKDRKLYSIENPGKYSLIGNTIDPAAIISQWPELLRFKTSIDAGCGFLPSVILRKLDC